MFFDFLSKAWQGQGMGTANLIVPKKDVTGKFPINPNQLFLSVVTGLRITEESATLDRAKGQQTIQESVLRRQLLLPADASEKQQVSFKVVVIVLERLIEEQETEAKDAEDMMGA